MASVAALESADGPVKERAASEIPDVELIRGHSGSTYILSSKGRSIAKHSQICGVGTGKFVSADSKIPGTVFDFEKGDKTLISAD